MNSQQKPEFDKENTMALFFNPEVPFNYKLFFIAGVVLYTLSPIDFIPDLLGPLGFADDLGIMVIASQAFTYFSNKALKEEYDAEQDQNTVIIEEPNSTTMRAQSSSQPSQIISEGQPRLPASHLRRHTPQEQAKPAAPVWDNDRSALHDEAHEQFLKEHQDMSDESFEKLMAERQRQRDAESNWDFSRNDSFAKKRGKKGD